MAAAVPACWLMPLEVQAGFPRAYHTQLVRVDSGGQCIDSWTALGLENFKAIYTESCLKTTEEPNKEREARCHWAGLLQDTGRAVLDDWTSISRRQSTCYSSVGRLRPFDVYLRGNQLDDINTALSLRHVDLVFFESGA
ncbi:hypothetical protein BJX66DRAFT_228410 [Aspergillus keveii]|uniref:Uncharacterized protein n=1 Tax=Aspergillus keveii TaxID=714993 RepID=A0ABR4GL13_9EURO